MFRSGSKSLHVTGLPGFDPRPPPTSGVGLGSIFNRLHLTSSLFLSYSRLRTQRSKQHPHHGRLEEIHRRRHWRQHRLGLRDRQSPARLKPEHYLFISTSRTLDKAQKAAKELDPTGERIVPMEVDIDDDSSRERFYEEVERQFGRVDVLINNAGEHEYEP